MNILCIAQHFAPEEVSGAVLATELTADLVRRGHTVSFVTTAPSYPQGRVFPGYRNRLLSRKMTNGVRVFRVWSYISPSKSFWARAFNFASFSLFAFFGGLAAGRPDVVFSYSPPLPLGLAAWLLARLWRVPWVLRIEDLFPDAAIAAGVLNGRSAIKFFSALERFLYARATHISVISDGFRAILIDKNTPAEKISVESVWTDPDQVCPLPKDNSFRAEHGLQGKFVVLYSGNIGQTSSLDEVLSAAEILQSDPAYRFLIVGEGIRKESLIQQAQSRGIKNISFLPFEPRARFAEMLAAADVTLVTLNSRSARYSLPSKTFSSMAAARPILAIVPLESELADIIQAARCGQIVPPGDPQGVADALAALKDDEDLCQQMGQCGRSALLESYSRKICVDRYEAMLREVNR